VRAELRRWLWRTLVVIVATSAMGRIGFMLPHFGARLTLPLLPSGIAVAATIRWGRWMWPAVFIAAALVNSSNARPWIVDGGVGLGLAGGAFLTAWILERNRFDASFARPRDVVAFLLAAGIGMALAPTFGMSGYWYTDTPGVPMIPINWLRWWGNVTAGVLLLTPLLIAINRQSLARLATQWVSSSVWVLALLVLVAAILFGESTTPVVRAPIVVFALILIVVGAIRFGLVPALAAALVVSGTTAASFAFSRGAFGGGDELGGLITIWSVAGALVSLSLVVTALLSERDAAAADKLRAERRYAQIFDGSPQPLWVHDPATLRFLLVNEAALRQYGWSREEFLERGVDALGVEGGEPVLPRGGAEALERGPGPFETRHRTRDGAVIDVEVWTRSIDLGGHAADLVFAIDVTERRALGRALLEAITGEQRRIGQEMHDGLGQELTGLALSLRALSNQAERERFAMAGELGQLADMVSGCIESTRRIVRGLSPLSDADGNLLGALESLAQTSSLSGTPVHLRTRLDAPLIVPLEVRSHLLRIAQEAVQNALKHAEAGHVDVELAVRPGGVTLSITDNGRGLGRDTPGAAGLGMRTMRFRATAIGGRLTVLRPPGGGTVIVCEAPQSGPVAARA
jgi:PAS domain S-box-containing protein